MNGNLRDPLRWCLLKPNAIIHVNDIYSKLGSGEKTIHDILNDTTDWKEKIKTAGELAKLRVMPAHCHNVRVGKIHGKGPRLARQFLEFGGQFRVGRFLQRRAQNVKRIHALKVATGPFSSKSGRASA